VSGAEGVTAPADRAPHWEWAEYAIAMGMPRLQARTLTRDQIKARLLPALPLTGEPSVDRLDEDPDARAARREAQRRPWEAR